MREIGRIEFVQVQSEFKLSTGHGFEHPEFEDTRRHHKLFKGPLSRNALYERISSGEKAQIVAWLGEDSLFFHKVDAALNYSGDRGLAEISWLLRMHYDGESFENRLEWLFALLRDHSLLEVSTV